MGELVKSTDLMFHNRPHESKTLGWGSALCVLVSLPGDLEAHSPLTTSAVERVPNSSHSLLSTVKGPIIVDA